VKMTTSESNCTMFAIYSVMKGAKIVCIDSVATHLASVFKWTGTALAIWCALCISLNTSTEACSQCAYYSFMRCRCM
jgi:hypothetical protein